MPPVGFEPTISAGELPQTYSLDRSAIGTGTLLCRYKNSSTLGRISWTQNKGITVLRSFCDYSSVVSAQHLKILETPATLNNTKEQYGNAL